MMNSPYLTIATLFGHPEVAHQRLYEKVRTYELFRMERK